MNGQQEVTFKFNAETGELKIATNDISKMSAALKEGAKAAKDAENANKALEKSVDRITTAVAAAAIGYGYFAVKMFDSLDAINDVADATGSTVEKLSALRQVAEKTGANFDTVSDSLVKFNKELQKPSEQSGANRALKAMGIDIKELKSMDPADAMMTIAKALDQYKDSAEKANIINTLFKGNVKEMAPYLKDLAEAGTLNATQTTKQAEEAEKLNKQIFQLKSEVMEFTRYLVSSAIPTISSFLANLRDIINMGDMGVVVNDAIKFAVTGNSRLQGDPGQQINEVIKERSKLKTMMDKAQMDLIGNTGEQAEQVRQQIADWTKEAVYLDRVLGVLKVKQRNGMPGASGEENYDRFDRMANPAKGNAPAIPGKPGRPGRKEKDNSDQFRSEHLARLKKMADEELKIAKARDDAISVAGLANLEAIDKKEQAEGRVNEQLQLQAKYILDSIEPNNQIFEQMELIEKLRDKGLITEEQKNKLLKDQHSLLVNQSDTFAAGWENAFKRFNTDAKYASELGSAVFKSMSQNMEDAIYKFATTGKITFTDFTRSVLADIARQQSAAAASGIMQFIGQAVLGYMTGGMSLTNAGATVAANNMSGDSLDNLINIRDGFGTGRANAAGGPANAGEIIRVGEQGPETLIMGASSGRIVSNGNSSGGGVQIGTIIIEVKGGKTNEETAGALNEQLVKTMKEIAKGEIANQRRPGGMLG